MIRVVTLQSHIYNKTPRKAGDEYEAYDRDVPFLVAFGNAAIATVSEPRLTSLPTKPENRRTYRRRDMRSE
jgi:hypothetical protein